MAYLNVVTLEEGVDLINRMDLTSVENELAPYFFDGEIAIIVEYYRKYLILKLSVALKVEENAQLWANSEIAKAWRAHAGGGFCISGSISDAYKNFCERFFGSVEIPQPANFSPTEGMKKITDGLFVKYFETSYSEMEQRLKDVAEKYIFHPK